VGKEGGWGKVWREVGERREALFNALD
jgi:hypothetical protein